MPHDELIALLNRARTVLDRYLFEADGQAIRDDVAEVCMAIDDALLQVSPPRLNEHALLERSAA
jgi:hypothetical protein